MPHVPASMALARFRLLDLTRVRAGPTCVKQLADLGTDVIKIELPPSIEVDTMSGPRRGFDMQNLHRNKRSMTLNIKLPQGREIFMQLVERAGVVVENFRPEVKSRRRIDYTALKRVNPCTLCSPRFPDSARTARAETGQASIRSRRAWAASRWSPASRGATPELGGHTNEILTELGYTAEAPAGLRGRNAI